MKARLARDLKGLNALQDWDVVGADMAKFVRLLDEESARLGDIINRGWQQELKQLPQKKSRKKKN